MQNIEWCTTVHKPLEALSNLEFIGREQVWLVCRLDIMGPGWDGWPGGVGQLEGQTE